MAVSSSSGAHHVVALRIGVRVDIELADGDHPFAFGGGRKLQVGVQRKQSDRSRGGCDRRTTAVLHDGVVLVQAGEGKTNLLTLAQALKIGGAEVPALQPLQQVAAKRGHVADVGCGGVSAGIGKHCVLRADGGVAADFGKRSQGTDGQSLRRDLDATQRWDIADIHQARRRIGAILHAIEQVDAPGFDDSAVFQLRKSGFDGSAIGKSERIHMASIDCWGWLRAASTTAGVMGSWRMRTPVAL